MRTERSLVWLQLLLGWLPIGALFALLIVSAHPEARPASAFFAAGRMMVAGAALGLVADRFIRHWPWPASFRLSFIAGHICAALAYALCFVAVNAVMESIIRGHAIRTMPGAGLGGFIALGVWLYIMIAGVVYANEATARAAQAESAAATSQLAALRAQLNPHFLFNALHTVVHLAPRDPARAAKAAEELAGLLRRTLEEEREVVELAEELGFVRRYLALESIRFGDRLKIIEDISPEALTAQVPVFAIQTLVENAVRHGATPSVEPTTVQIVGRSSNGRLTVTVSDSGAGAAPGTVEASSGTGLRRLRERLGVLYRGRATLDARPSPRGGFIATLVVPVEEAQSE